MRITPAYAGTTPDVLSALEANKDHPRLRGNYLNLVYDLLRRPGSPPLTRELRL